MTNDKRDDGNPFAKLAGLRDALPAGPAPATTTTTTTTPVDDPFKAKLVVRFERKGHGGKTVTVVSGIAPKHADDVATEMKKALGCGARVEDGDVVLQGELVPRAIAWLEKKGAKNVVDGTGGKKK